MENRRSILLIDNSPAFLFTVKDWLELHGYQVYGASSIEEAKQILDVASIQLIVTDLRVTNDSDERDHSGLHFARSVAPTIPKIILTSFPTLSTVREALQADLTREPLPVAVSFIGKLEGLERLLEEIDQAFHIFVKANYAQFKVGGALTDADAAVYVSRQAEREIVACIRRMDYLLVIEPRQQGKTSLINYLLRNPELTETVVIYIDIAAIGRSTQASWYDSLCTRVLEQLDRVFPNSKWPSIPNEHVQWRHFLSDLAALFESSHKNLVIALDEIGTNIPNATGFFSVLRDTFNSRQAEPHFRRLTFLLVGAFHPRDLVEDDKVSPFNIARRIRLSDFTLEQIWRLISNIASSTEQADILAARMYHWTSGQPYLTQQLCAYLRPDATMADVDIAVERLRREDENHLPPLLKRINSDKLVRAYVNRIIGNERIKFYPVENQMQAQLELLGIIKYDTNGYCVFRNRIYEQSITLSETFDSLRKRDVAEYDAADVIDSHHDSSLNEAGRFKDEAQSPAPNLAPNTRGIQMNAKTTILFLAADPSDISRLRLGQELREIQEKLQMSEMRDKFNLKQRLSIRPVDISQAILDERPQIIHFSGHGTSDGELCFEDEMGQAKTVQPDALGALFELVADQVDCVLMNACYSAIQANAIAKYIKFVIGMNKEIGDKAAISFAIGFYQALGAGKSVEEAYKFGCVQIRLQSIPEHLTPVILKKE